MEELIITGSLASLVFLVMNTTDNTSGDVMKGVGIIAICCLIGFVYTN